MRTSQNFAQLESQSKQAKSFVKELEKKLQNILALVRITFWTQCKQLNQLEQLKNARENMLIRLNQLFNRIQIANDRSMMSNGEKMHAILLATQEDAKISREIALRSHEIAEEMKQDSVAMKTVSILAPLFPFLARQRERNKLNILTTKWVYYFLDCYYNNGLSAWNFHRRKFFKFGSWFAHYFISNNDPSRRQFI